jgi:hypothetical protein
MNKSGIKAISKKSTPSPTVLHTQTMSFNELALRYLASHKFLLSESMLNARVAHLSEWLLVFFGMQLLNDIRPERLEKFIYILEGKGLQPRKIQSCLVTFRACMKYAYDQKWLLDPTLSKPLLHMNEQLLDDHSFMSPNEYLDLYQDLVQEVTHQTFH